MEERIFEIIREEGFRYFVYEDHIDLLLKGPYDLTAKIRITGKIKSGKDFIICGQSREPFLTCPPDEMFEVGFHTIQAFMVGVEAKYFNLIIKITREIEKN